MKKVWLLMFALLFVPSAKAQQNHTVLLNWAASTTAGVTYNVYRETFSGACTPTSVGTGPGCLKLNVTPLTVLTFTDTTVPQGATSFYVIRAFSSTTGLESANSNEVSALVPLPPPAPPTGLTAKVN